MRFLPNGDGTDILRARRRSCYLLGPKASTFICQLIQDRPRESNPQPTAQASSALQTELILRIKKPLVAFRKSLKVAAQAIVRPMEFWKISGSRQSLPTSRLL